MKTKKIYDDSWGGFGQKFLVPLRFAERTGIPAEGKDISVPCTVFILLTYTLNNTVFLPSYTRHIEHAADRHTDISTPLPLFLFAFLLS